MTQRQPNHTSAARVTHVGRGLLGAIHEELTGVKLEAPELCAQCKANADWNEAGGYAQLAEACRQYCRNGHRE